MSRNLYDSPYNRRTIVHTQWGSCLTHTIYLRFYMLLPTTERLSFGRYAFNYIHFDTYGPLRPLEQSYILVHWIFPHFHWFSWSQFLRYMAKIIEYLNTGCPVRPENLSRSRNHTYSSQNLMKLAGQVKWVLPRVCKIFLANIPNTLVKYGTFYGSLLLQWESSVSPTKWREI